MAAVTLGSNISSERAQRRLSQTTSTASDVYQRLSSGQRINKASDDAAGLAIATSLTTDSRIFTQAVRNVNDGISAINIVEGATRELSNIVIRIQELAEQSANGVYSNTQRGNLDKEAQALRSEYNRIISTTRYNGRNLLSDTDSNLQIQVGRGENTTLEINIGNLLQRMAGNGSFATPTSSGLAGSFRETLALGDFNEDGKLDIASGNQFGTQLLVSLGNGDGTFKVETAFSGSATRSLQSFDINKDGHLDLIGSSDGAPGGITVALGTGTGSFAAPFQTSFGAQLYRTAIADVNGDTVNDLIVGDTSNSKAWVLIGNSNGTFYAPVSYQTIGSQGIAVADFNNDGQLDISQGGATAFGNGNGTFLAPVTYGDAATNIASVTLSQAAHDINGDGIIDILGAGSRGVIVRLGNADGSFRLPTSYGIATLSGNDFVIQDFNDDGILDVALTDSGAGNKLATFMGNSDGSFQAPTTYQLGFDPRGIRLGDINGDEVVDIVAMAVGQSPSTWSLIGNGAGTKRLGTFSLATQVDARSALDSMGRQLGRITSEVGQLGAFQRRLQTSGANLTVARENYTSAASRIMDSDVAEDAAKLVQAQILQQVGSAILAQANLSPQIALRLLQG